MTAADATRGRLAAWIGSSQAWGTSSKHEEGFEWTWIELLEHLAEVWPYLQWEETVPLDEQVELENLRAKASERWDQLPDAEARNDEEEVVWAFEQHHDLAAALQGAWVAPVRLLREGHGIWITTNGHPLRRSLQETLDTLSQLGDVICARLGGLEEPRAGQALERWQERTRTSVEEFVLITTGIPNDALTSVTSHIAAVDLFELDPSKLEVTEMLAAARMVGASTTQKDLAVLLARVKAATARQTAELDALSHRAAHELSTWAAEHAWRQGYLLAKWLRGELAATSRFEPEHVLKQWGVTVTDDKLASSLLDAVAVWGPRHGPLVIVNKEGPHAQSDAGRRATLAHEICHLLADRYDALPLAEALGGRSPRFPEKRAGAFAAELLLPQEIAGKAMQGNDPEQAMTRLRDEFGVSEEIIAWQVRNSRVLLADDVHAFLKSKVSEPWKF